MPLCLISRHKGGLDLFCRHYKGLWNVRRGMACHAFCLCERRCQPYGKGDAACAAKEGTCEGARGELSHCSYCAGSTQRRTVSAAPTRTHCCGRSRARSPRGLSDLRAGYTSAKGRRQRGARAGIGWRCIAARRRQAAGRQDIKALLTWSLHVSRGKGIQGKVRKGQAGGREAS